MSSERLLFPDHADPDDPRVAHAHRQATACMTPVRVPFEGVGLTGWFCRAHRGRGPRPLLVLLNGFDGPAQEMHTRSPGG